MFQRTLSQMLYLLHTHYPLFLSLRLILHHHLLFRMLWTNEPKANKLRQKGKPAGRLSIPSPVLQSTTHPVIAAAEGVSHINQPGSDPPDKPPLLYSSRPRVRRAMVNFQPRGKSNERSGEVAEPFSGALSSEQEF